MPGDQTVSILLIILSAAFGLWAVIVGIAAKALLNQVSGTREAFVSGFAKLDEELSAYIRITESRLATIEEWRNHVDRKIGDR